MTAKSVREKTLVLLRFLQEFVNVRRRRGTTYSSDDHLLWWEELLAGDNYKNCIYSPLLPAKQMGEKETEIWLEIKKPSEPAPPEPPELLRPWIKGFPRSLHNDREEPQLFTELTRGPQKQGDLFTGSLSEADSFEHLKDHPEVSEAFARYLPRWRQWCEEHRKWSRVHELYSRLDMMRRQAEHTDETYELVMAFGLLTGEVDRQKVRRHVFIAPVEIELEPVRGKIRVRPAADFEHFKVDLSMLPSHMRPDLRETPLTEKLTELDNDLTQTELVKDLLNLVGNHLSPDIVIDPDSFQCHGFDDSRLSLRFAPAVVLRQRVSTGYEETVNQLLSGFSQDQFQETAPWQKLILEGHSQDDIVAKGNPIPAESRKASKQNTSPDDLTVYFPLPSNEEQRRIANRLQHHSSVLVKGPPGTGKSQTIANLICHLLALGNRLLVTAESAKALTVLRDMLPEDIQDLCVIALGSSHHQLELMEESVHRIISRAESWNEEVKVREIRELTAKLEKCREEIARLQNELVEIRGAETQRCESLSGSYRGTAAQIVEKVKRREKKYSWLPKKAPRSDFPLSEDELGFFADWHANLTDDRRKELNWGMGDLRLPEAHELENHFRRRDELQGQVQGGVSLNDAEKMAFVEHIPSERLVGLREALSELAEVNRATRVLLGEAANQVISDFVQGKKHDWLVLIRTWQDCLNELNPRAKFIESTQVTYPDQEVENELLSLAKKRADYFRQGGKRRRLWFFTPKIIRETQRVELCRVNGQPPQNLADLETLIRYFELKQRITSCFEMWPGKVGIPQGGLLPVALKLRDWQRQLVALYRCFEKNLQKLSVIPIEDWIAFFLVGHIEQWQRVVQRELARRQLVEVEQTLEKLRLQCDAQWQQTGNPTLAKCRDALATGNVALWSEALKEESSRQALREKHSRYLELRKKLQRAYPELKTWLARTEGQLAAFPRLANLRKAWLWAQARGWVQRITEPGRYLSVKLKLEQAQKEEKDLLRQLASLKAWQSFMQRLDDRTRQNLQAWAKTIRRIGRGTGKRAPRMRRQARQYLRECLPKMPVWIMPLHRVWETASGQPGIFDTIIVDEASQAGLDSLLLLLMGKRIVVVGDDQQNSPEGHFVELNRIEALIDRYLKKVFDFSESYRPEFSLYDHALRAFGLPITLREHFRCVPDIIRFSNQLCYRDEPLIPLRQAPPNALKPLQAVYVAEGYTDGESPKIINRPEAERIVNTIKECLEDPAYEGKTFGVITLQGQSQMELIQRLLIEKINPRELEERKLTCGTSSTFQGDQRDVIFLSMVVAPNQRFRSLTSDSEKRRFNVAMSRARNQVWLFHSVRLEDLATEDLRYQLCHFFYSPETMPPDGVYAQREVLETAVKNTPNRKLVPPPKPFESWFEVDVALEILAKGYRVKPQWEVAGYRIDLVVEGKTRRMAIECDGDTWHGPERFLHDFHRQLQLERAGWTFVRIPASEFYAARKRCLNYVFDKCRELDIYPVIEEEGQDLRERPSQICDRKNGTATHTAQPGDSLPETKDLTSQPASSLTPLSVQQKSGFLPFSSLDQSDEDSDISAPIDVSEPVVARSHDSTTDVGSCPPESSDGPPQEDEQVPVVYHAVPAQVTPTFRFNSPEDVVEFLECGDDRVLKELFWKFFPEEEDLWKHLAAWAKNHNLFDANARKFLYKVGESFSPTRGWSITPRQRTWARDLLVQAIKKGFLREAGIDWLQRLFSER